MLTIAAGLAVLAWLVEGRRRRSGLSAPRPQSTRPTA